MSFIGDCTVITLPNLSYSVTKNKSTFSVLDEGVCCNGEDLDRLS